MSNSNNIKVIVRPRPLDETKKEKVAMGFEVQRNKRITYGQRIYDPDVTVDSTASQDEVFEHLQGPIEAVRAGHNGTIMVYGQTGTGKTYSMFGAGPNDRSGVTFRAMDALLGDVHEGVRNECKMSLGLSVLELYNEKITDLLDGGAEVTLQQGFPRSCKKEILSSSKAAHQLVQKAVTKRHTAATQMNDRSSRSHLIVMLELCEEVNGTYTSAHLFLVDLAGSENIKKSDVSGKAVREAGMINKSLLALKNVVMTLASHSQDGPRPHVPYRVSKLTEILQDSIGGTAKTCLMSCISLLGRDMEETKNTLEYSSKARAIRNVQDRDKLQSKVRQLETEVEKMRNKLSFQAGERGTVTITKEEHEELLAKCEERDAMEEEIEQLSSQIATEQAKHSINESQVETTRAMLLGAEQELDHEKAKQENQSQQFLNLLHSIRSTTKRAMNTMQEINQRTITTMCGKVRATHIDAEGFKAEVKKIHEDANAQAAQQLSQLTTLADEFEADMTELDQEQAADYDELHDGATALIEMIAKLKQRAPARAKRQMELVHSKIVHTEKKLTAVPLVSELPLVHAVDNMAATFETDMASNELEDLTMGGTDELDAAVKTEMANINTVIAQATCPVAMAIGRFDGVFTSNMPPPTPCATAGGGGFGCSPSRERKTAVAPRNTAFQRATSTGKDNTHGDAMPTTMGSSQPASGATGASQQQTERLRAQRADRKGALGALNTNDGQNSTNLAGKKRTRSAAHLDRHPSSSSQQHQEEGGGEGEEDNDQMPTPQNVSNSQSKAMQKEGRTVASKATNSSKSVHHRSRM